jgi:hypothetical protein
MLSMIQQSISKGIVEFIYKHLKARYTNRDGILTQVVEKDKIEVLFKSSTNLNNKLEDERLMLKAENMQSMVGVIDSIAASPNIPVKVKSENFLEFWRAEMEKNPHIRDMFEMMSEEERARLYGPDLTPNTGVEGGEVDQEGAQQQADEPPQEVQTKPAPKEEEVKVEKVQPNDNVETKQEQVIRNTFQ